MFVVFIMAKARPDCLTEVPLLPFDPTSMCFLRSVRGEIARETTRMKMRLRKD